MGVAKEEAEWNRLSNLMCLIRNVNIWDSTKTKASKPSDFNPYARGRKEDHDDGFAAAKELARQAGAFNGGISE